MMTDGNSPIKRHSEMTIDVKFATNVNVINYLEDDFDLSFDFEILDHSLNHAECYVFSNIVVQVEMISIRDSSKRMMFEKTLTVESELDGIDSTSLLSFGVNDAITDGFSEDESEKLTSEYDKFCTAVILVEHSLE